MKQNQFFSEKDLPTYHDHAQMPIYKGFEAW